MTTHRNSPGIVAYSLTPSNPYARSRDDRQPYANLAEIIARAMAGDRMHEPRKPTPAPRKIAVKLAPTEPRKPNVAYTSITPSTPGQVIAAELIHDPDPFGVQVPATDFTDQELATAQQAGTRWLARTGHSDLRLSYRRQDDHVAWILTKRKRAA